MDPTLLQKRQTALPEPEPVENNRNGLPEEFADGHYEDLQIELPQKPVRLTFDPPMEFDGQQYSELIFDFDRLNGKDFQRAEKTFNKLYKAERNEIVLPESKHLYHCILAAQVADVQPGLIMKLPRRYYTPLRLRVLKACGSSLEEENE